MPEEEKATSGGKYVPPNPPWIEITGDISNGSYLSFYFSDPYSDVPVRRISSELDSKSDPNFETGTFGLFSTCERVMRASLVSNNMKYIFFCTMRRESRVLTGYYELGWYSTGPQIKGYIAKDGKTRPDFQLASRRGRFVDPGFVLSDLVGYLEGTDLSRRFRSFKKLDPKITVKLLALIDQTEDKTKTYLSEVRRLEEENLKKVGFAYPNWKRKESFSWDDAGHYLGKE